MKKRMSRVVIGFAVGLVAFSAVAWDHASRSIYELEVDNINNPAGSVIGIADSVSMVGNMTVTGNVTVTGAGTFGVITGTITNFTGNGVNITNLQGGNIAAGNIAEGRISNALVNATTVGDAGTVLSGVGTAITALNGENIQDGTIDDDSLDFTDITGADLTLTDVTALTTLGATTLGGTTVAITNNATVAGTFGVTGASSLGETRLSSGLTFISGAYTGVLNIVGTGFTLVVNETITNVIHADITSE